MGIFRKLCLITFVIYCVSPLCALRSQPPSPSAAYKNSQRKDAESKGGKADSDTDLQVTQGSPLLVNTQNPGRSKPSQTDGANLTNDKPAGNWRDDPNWWVAGFTGLLVLIALSQAVFFAVQLQIMKRSLTHGRIASDAAKVSADIATNTERAWLVTNVTFSSNWPDISDQGGPVKSVMVTNIENAGRSPAELSGTHIVCHLVSKEWLLPDDPAYGNEESIYEVNSLPGEIIPVKGSRYTVSPIQRFDLLTDSQIEQIRLGNLILYCYGKIAYTDISEVQRVTQFGYFFYRRSGTLDGQPEGMYRLNNRKYNYTT
jgi:hypothetical protein